MDVAILDHGKSSKVLMNSERKIILKLMKFHFDFHEEGCQ